MSQTFSRTVWPSSPEVPDKIRSLLSSFFELGDSTSEESSRRLGQEVFLRDGRIVVNKKVISGAEEISASNHGILSSLRARRHQVEKVYTCNKAANDLMLFGTVTWTFKDGRELDGPFAARAVVDTSGDELRLSLYQGWADMTELQASPPSS